MNQISNTYGESPRRDTTPSKMRSSHSNYNPPSILKGARDMKRPKSSNVSRSNQSGARK